MTKEIIRQIIEDQDLQTIEITEEGIKAKVMEWDEKCEGVEFAPYINVNVQKRFYLMFDGLVEIEERIEGDGDSYKVTFNKWYKKNAVSYYIGWLNIINIEHMMKRSIKLKEDIILELAKTFQDDEEREEKENE